MNKYFNNTDSHNVIKDIIKIQDNIRLDYSVVLNSTTNNILYNMYNDIKNSIDKIKSIFDDRVKLIISNEKFVIDNNLDNALRSIYVSKRISNYIFNTDSKSIKYIFHDNKEYRINFIVYNKTIDSDYLEYLNMCAINIFSIIHFLEKSRKLSCKTDILEIYIFFTPFKKELPQQNDYVIGPENVNSGLTLPCRDITQVIVYRKEEFMKVIIHELIHSMAIDLTHTNSDYKNRLDKFFNIESTYNLNETYTELWALIINILFFVGFTIDNHIDEIGIIQVINDCIRIETKFSIIQVIKILNFMSLSLKDLTVRDKNSRFKENTHVFGYYIMKYLLLYDLNKFINVCNYKSSNILTISSDKQHIVKYKIEKFINIIIKLMENQQFIIKFSKIENWFDSVNNKNNILFNTMRMTCIELA